MLTQFCVYSVVNGSMIDVLELKGKKSINLTCRNCEGNIGEVVEQEVKVCDEVETVGEFTYLGNRESDGGGCEVAITARSR